MTTNTTNTFKREFIINIETANEEVERLDARIAELEAQLNLKSPPVAAPVTPVRKPAPAAPQLTGIARATRARQLAIQKGAK